MVKKRVLLIVLVLGIFAFSCTTQVSAHSGDEFSAWAVVTPTIDGTMSAGEWDDAASDSATWTYSIPSWGVDETHDVDVYVKNDADYLYIAVVISDDDYLADYYHSGGTSVLSGDVLQVLFDNDHDAASNTDYEQGDDILRIRANGYTWDGFYDYISSPSPGGGWIPVADTADGGTDDLTGAVSHTNPTNFATGDWTFEFRQPLDSTDNTHDISLSGGDTVGIYITFFDWVIDSSTGVIKGNVQPDYPTNYKFADVVIASAPTPEDIKDVLNNLPDDAFKNNADNRRNALGNMLDDVQDKIDAGDYEGAINKLEVIRAKMDGCFGGNPNNDWITDCAAQAEVLAVIDALIEYLESLL